MTRFSCSVVIPSYNRQETLALVLAGLEEQTISPASFEVIVVLDGSTDGSMAMVSGWQESGRLPNLRVYWQENAGQATARNNGARQARSPVLIFLDDDVVPAPDLVEVHLAHHATGAHVAVLGEAQIVREQAGSLYHQGVWRWWEDTYQQRAEPGRRPTCRDFCAGNVSLRKEDFLWSGGFDPGFRGYGGEDFELGYRLLKDGVTFIADRRARACHYHRTTVEGVLRATRQEAAGDARLAELHPELRQGLRMSTLPSAPFRWLVYLALLLPGLGDLLVSAVQAMLPVFERLQMRRRWQMYFNHARGYAYWRGVRDVFGSLAALKAYQSQVWSQALPLQAIDISSGIPHELPPVWVEGPSRLEVTWQGQMLGEVHLQGPITAPLRPYLAEAVVDQLGEHLLFMAGAEIIPGLTPVAGPLILAGWGSLEHFQPQLPDNPAVQAASPGGGPG